MDPVEQPDRAAGEARPGKHPPRRRSSFRRRRAVVRFFDPPLQTPTLGARPKRLRIPTAASAERFHSGPAGAAAPAAVAGACRSAHIWRSPGGRSRANAFAWVVRRRPSVMAAGGAGSANIWRSGSGARSAPATRAGDRSASGDRTGATPGPLPGSNPLSAGIRCGTDKSRRAHLSAPNRRRWAPRGAGLPYPRPPRRRGSLPPQFCDRGRAQGASDWPRHAVVRRRFARLQPTPRSRRVR